MLNAEDGDRLLDAVSNAGSQGANKLKLLMKDFSRTGSGVDLSWSRAQDYKVRWKATTLERFTISGESWPGLRRPSRNLLKLEAIFTR